nr:hypothetical protein [Helicobacter pylori]
MKNKREFKRNHTRSYQLKPLRTS